MTPGVFDHLLAVLLVVVMPFFSSRSRAGIEQVIAERGDAARRIVYGRLMFWQWTCAVATIALWAVSGRSWPALGISMPQGWGFFAASAVSIAVLGHLGWQVRLVRTRPDVAAQVRESAANLAFMLPSTPADMRMVKYLCLTAGVVEELLFRGFLLWYLGAYLPLWAAVIVAAVAFAIGHLYQGRIAALQTGAAALVAAGLYVLAGSLWVPMVLHGAFNYLQLRMMYEAMRGAPVVAEESMPDEAV